MRIAYQIIFWVKINTIYGKNATGKSNLGLALFDITKNLLVDP